jgi:hypothetical protein
MEEPRTFQKRSQTQEEASMVFASKILFKQLRFYAQQGPIIYGRMSILLATVKEACHVDTCSGIFPSLSMLPPDMLIWTSMGSSPSLPVPHPIFSLT